MTCSPVCQKHPTVRRTCTLLVKTHRASIKPGRWEHPGTFQNIPEHLGISNDYDNYEKISVKLNFGLADVTIWSAQIDQCDMIFLFAGRTTNGYGRTFHRGKSIEKYMKSLIIDNILSGGENVSTEY